MDKPITLHFLFYGPYGTSDEEYLTMNFIGRNIARTAWYAISTCMEDTNGNPVSDDVSFAQPFIYYNTDKFGSTLDTNAKLLATLQGVIKQANLQTQAADIYVLVSHDDVATPSLCQEACGYHSYYNDSNGNQIKYIFVGAGGYSNKCPACSTSNVNGPWGPLTNQLVNTFVHFLVDTVSDPIPYTGWCDSEDNEAAVKCESTFIETCKFASNTSKEYNIEISDGNVHHWFLIQANWDIITNACRMWPYSDCSFIAPPTPLMSTAHGKSSGNILTVGFSLVVSILFAFFLI